MAVYEYTAKDESGANFAGIYSDVGSIAVLRRELAKMGFTLLRARRKKTPAQKPRKIKRAEVVTFAYELAGMCSAGLSIIKALETLQEQTENPDFKFIISDIKQSVEAGSSLKEAFEKYREVFSDFFLGMLEAGESGGKLSKTLEISAIYLEKQADLKHKVKSVFAYPIIVAILALGVVASMVTFVVPVFSKLYRQLRLPLPGPTQTLISMSTLVRDWWWAILLLIVGFVLLCKRFSKNPYVKARWDGFKLNMPVFANLNRKVVVCRFMRTFAMLASTGVSLVKALGIASVVANNSQLSHIAERLQQSIKAGNPVASSLKDYDIFPPMLIQLAASGEEAGALPEMLNKGVDFLDKDIDRTMNALLVKLEPALTIIMGAAVGFILIAVYLPMFDYMAQLK